MTHPRSTRTRLTFYFTAVFGVMVVCLAVASYLVFRHEAFTDLDSSLNVAVSATAMSAAHELDEHKKQDDGEADLQSILDLSSESVLPDTQLLIRQGDRGVAHKGVSGPVFDLRKLRTQQILASTQLEGLRVAGREIQVPKFHATYEIFAASAVEPTLSKLRSFRLVLFVCVPLGLALAAVAGYALAHRALAPLNELTCTIEAITSSDLSARVQLHNATSDFSWLASRFNSLLDRLEKAFHFQRQFMADASHELRTPLTVALSAAQVTGRDNGRSVADCDETLSLVEEQILRLKGIVDKMLFLSQVDASSVHLEKREFFLDDVISEAARAAKVLARMKQQTLRISELPEALCSGDEMLSKQAVLILLDNAVKYTQVGGEIAVSLTADQGNWCCRVWNNGPAIPSDAQPHIFERFYRATSGANIKTAGSGLGLSIARSIAETHRGKLSLLSSGKDGNTFELVYPGVQMADEVLGSQPKSLAVKI